MSHLAVTVHFPLQRDTQREAGVDSASTTPQSEQEGGWLPKSGEEETDGSVFVTQILIYGKSVAVGSSTGGN